MKDNTSPIFEPSKRFQLIESLPGYPPRLTRPEAARQQKRGLAQVMISIGQSRSRIRKGTSRTMQPR
jgi:hypothetical protein